MEKRSIYQKIAPIYEHPANCLFYQRIAESLCQLINEFAKHKFQSIHHILELGAGTGLATQVLRRYFPRADILVTEPCLEMLKVAKEKNISKVKYLVLKAEDAPILRQRYDLIFGSFCYHWFEKNTAMRLKKCLKPDGLLAFSIPVNCADGVLGNRLLIKIYRALKKHYGLSLKPALNFKRILKEFAGFNLYYRLLSFTETHPAHAWGQILRSRGSWQCLFGELAKEAEMLWQEYSNKKEIPLKWHIMLLVGENNEKIY